jgi:hypothetical protein
MLRIYEKFIILKIMSKKSKYIDGVIMDYLKKIGKEYKKEAIFQRQFNY